MSTNNGLRLCALGFLTGALLLGSVRPVLAQQDQQIECVKRVAPAEPPPFAGPPRPTDAAGRDTGERNNVQSEVRPSAVCAEGAVPETKEIAPNRPGFGKGNPLLRPGAPLIVPDALQPHGALRPFRSFGEVYGARRQVKSPPGQPACDGVWQNGACYYYGSAALLRTADGGGMTISVKRPGYNNSGGPGHTLDEISVQGGSGNGNIVEIGWLVSSEMNGNPDPHIFVFHWAGTVPSCYNGCGWQQSSNVYYPGQNIRRLIDRDVYVGYVFWQGNWFDNQWMGYFPGSLWNNGYSRNGLIQWFGEVASLNGIPPKTQMGTEFSRHRTAPPISRCAMSMRGRGSV